MVRVKLCGVTRPDDARSAVALGVDAIGLNFVTDSPRRVTPESALAIGKALPPFVLRVGVFADQPFELVVETVRRARLHCVQFHGEESPESCAAAPVSWYKAHRVGPAFRIEDVTRYAAGTFLLDTFTDSERGGTGRTFDWDIARRASSHGRVILAGGLNPDNVARAIATARPYAVDINSGVESAPGCKDADLVAAVMSEVARAGAGRGDAE